MTPRDTVIADAQALIAALQAMTPQGGALSLAQSLLAACNALPGAAVSYIRPVVISEPPLDLTKIVAPDFTCSGIDTYDRYDCFVEWKKPTVSVRIMKTNVSAGSSHSVAFAYPRYGLLVKPLMSVAPDGTPTWGPEVDRASGWSVDAGANWSGHFTVTPGPEDGRPALVRVCAYDAAGVRVAAPTECFAPRFVQLNRNGQLAAFPHYEIARYMYDWVHPNYGADRMVPAQFQYLFKPKAWLDDPPTYWAKATPVCATPAVQIAIDPSASASVLYGQCVAAGSQLTRDNPLGGADSDAMSRYFPSWTRSGHVTVSGAHDYYFNDIMGQKFPSVANEVDGPVPVGFWNQALQVMLSRRPDVVARKVYVGTKLAWGREFNGIRTTLVGLVNKDNRRHYRGTITSGVGVQYDEPATLDDFAVRGLWPADWPADQRYLEEGWATVDHPQNSMLNLSADPVAAPPGTTPEQPHQFPPRFAHTARSGVWMSTFDGSSPLARDTAARPAVMTPLALDPDRSIDYWGMDVWPRTGNLIVSERGKHRIVEMDWTGKVVRVVLEDSTSSRFGAVNQQIRTFVFNPAMFNIAGAVANAVAAAKTVRSQTKICAPECVKVRGDWCYYSAYAMGAVMRVHLVDGTVQLCCLPSMDYLRQSHLVNFTVDDGSFSGVADTIYTVTHAQTNNGMPQVWFPFAAVGATGETLTHSKNGDQLLWGSAGSVKFDMPSGPQGTFGGVYPTCVDLFAGELIVAGVGIPGYARFRRKTAADVPMDYTKAKAGRRAARLNGLDMMFNQYGPPSDSMPYPVGMDPAIDYCRPFWGFQ